MIPKLFSFIIFVISLLKSLQIIGFPHNKYSAIFVGNEAAEE